MQVKGNTAVISQKGVSNRQSRYTYALFTSDSRTICYVL